MRVHDHWRIAKPTRTSLKSDTPAFASIVNLVEIADAACYPGLVSHAQQRQGRDAATMVTQTYDTATLVQMDIEHMLHPVTNLHQHARTGPLVLARGEGSRIYDTDGKEYIDGFAGLW